MLSRPGAFNYNGASLNLNALQSAVRNNGEVLDALIEHLGIADELGKKLDERRYTRDLENCRALVADGRGRNADAGPGTIILGRNAEGFPLAVSFNAISDEQKPLFEGKKEGDTVTMPDGVVITLSGVFDLRPVAPAGDGKHPAVKRGRGRKR